MRQIFDDHKYDYIHLRRIYKTNIYDSVLVKYHRFLQIFIHFIKYKLYDVICKMNYANKTSRPLDDNIEYLAHMCIDNTPDTDTADKVNIKYAIFLNNCKMLYLDDIIKQDILKKIKEKNIQCIYDKDDNTIYNAIKATINTDYAIKATINTKIFNIKEKYDDIKILYDDILAGFDKLLVVGELEEFTKLLCHNIETPFVYIPIVNHIPDKKQVPQEKNLTCKQ